jgi:hypothetical protein
MQHKLFQQFTEAPTIEPLLKLVLGFPHSQISKYGTIYRHT